MPSRYDVIGGRGGECFKHLGNIIFRQIIEDNLDRYYAAAEATRNLKKVYHRRGHYRRCSAQEVAPSSLPNSSALTTKSNPGTQLASCDQKSRPDCS